MSKQQTRYLIICEYDEYVRVYSFLKNTELIGGENLEQTPNLKKELKKTTKTLWEK
ncbi:MAG: hypothetical protein GF311_18900 [Candidatus Lokiarchaeota archaeon]|nr:hypothetical protein [Candidatus Lokiarchaeota archaeon]